MEDLLRKVPLSSDIVTQTELSETIFPIENGLSNIINPKLSTIANLVSAEVLRLDELSGKISGGGGSSIDDYISAITINGTTKTPVDKVVDLGSISSYIPEYTPLSAHNSLVSSYTALESRVLSIENLIGDILSILQEINDTEGE